MSFLELTFCLQLGHDAREFVHEFPLASDQIPKLGQILQAVP